jgi:hypothetical protein
VFFSVSNFRFVARGEAMKPFDGWIPRHADEHAARQLLSRLPAQRVGAFRSLAFAALRSPDPMARAAAHLLLGAIRDGDPARVFSDAGLARAGGHHGVRGITALAWRDAALRQLARTVFYRGMSDLGIARAMISGFDRYESRCWPRDSASARWPQAGPDMMWCEMLRRKIHLPRTPRHLAAILSREIQSRD